MSSGLTMRQPMRVIYVKVVYQFGLVFKRCNNNESGMHEKYKTVQI